ncbi:MAG: MBL fold metallo-hydrolase, partial [Pseudomonadota bacterium]
MIRVTSDGIAVFGEGGRTNLLNSPLAATFRIANHRPLRFSAFKSDRRDGQMTLEIYQYPYGPGANYGVLLHDPVAEETASVDAGDATALLAALDKTGWPLTEIWITHHHHDHTDGLEEVKAKTGCTVRGPAPESQPIAGLDLRHGDGDSFTFAGHPVQVLHTPGHTTDMINFYLPSEGLVFTGDTL